MDILIRKLVDCILGVVSAICKKLQIPHFTAIWQPIDVDNFKGTDSFTRNLFPHAKKYSEALAEIVKSFQWINFAIIYDSDENLAKYQDTFTMSFTLDFLGRQTVRLYKLPAKSNDYKLLLKDIAKTGINEIIIDCTAENTLLLFSQSIEMELMSEYMVCFEFKSFTI